MKRGFASKRRAEEFDALLSGRTAAGRSSVGEYAELLEVVASLRSVPEVSARPEFVADLRSRLMTEAAARPERSIDAATVARLTPAQRRGTKERRLAAALGGFAVVAASGSMAVASQGALPGDVLYPMKRAIENAHTNLQADDAAKATTLIAHAEQRIAEVEALTAADGEHSATIAATLQDFSEQASQAAELALDEYAGSGDVAAIEELRTFTATSMQRLTSLGDAVPVDARPALVAAAQTVRQADNAAFQACPTCGDAPITELPEFASQPIDPLLSGFAPSATAAPAPDFTEIMERVEAAKKLLRAEEREAKAEEAGPEPAEDEQLPPVEEPVENTDPLGDLKEGVDDLLDPDKGTGADDEKSGTGDGGKQAGTKGFDDVSGGVVDGVTGLIGGLLP